MSSRDLIGRPLVPFFDADDNVNTSLVVDPSTRAHEALDVDARVWDKELGYFVYPNEEPSSTARHTSNGRGAATSAPIAIAGSHAPAPSSCSKLLLTPDMLSRSAPDSSSLLSMRSEQPSAPLPTDSNRSTPRSNSVQRGSRSKSRSNTPRKEKQRQQPSSVEDSSSGDDKTNGARRNGRKQTNGDGQRTATPKKSSSRGNKPAKQKEDLSAATGKWAWSAFQSSPDPKSLPLPPFAGPATESPKITALPPPRDPPKITERLDPPLEERPRPPSVPPERGQDAPPLPPTSIEHSMTQDLRRMLNIGGA
ncbi:hypothetical protein P43SY_009563 [Pythium insidiosum]|uniref:Uncharacterized protein n=1 Tax=Pythium insidiosum TaxID=114742 RepID=A0AAD5QBR3_PYTIN|nr:hypothetical protein P43SY_009563 [Pythium insidiosum]